jgi:hypothetical protein
MSAVGYTFYIIRPSTIYSASSLGLLNFASDEFEEKGEWRGKCPLKKTRWVLPQSMFGMVGSLQSTALSHAFRQGPPFPVCTRRVDSKALISKLMSLPNKIFG